MRVIPRLGLLAAVFIGLMVAGSAPASEVESALGGRGV